LETSILGLMPQAVVTSVNGSLDPKAHPASELAALKQVDRMTPLVMGDVVLQSARNVGVGVMLGIAFDEYEPLTEYLTGAYRHQLEPGSYNAILGEKLAGELG
ncbi:lipoprotein-releasing system transmembrane subunit LolC, partial [Enterobacter hormaechei]|nr:lipoprotein-releasing system transmembrane subunit LolC [Enterobacter hormaechei]